MINSKKRISNAALNLFIKRGIRGTTTKEIAKKAGIAESTIYKHFKSKDDLALKLFLNYMDLFRNKLIESVNDRPSSRGKLKALIEAFFDFAKNEPKAYSYIMVGHHTELSKVPGERLKPKDIFVEVIQEGISKGEFRQIDENVGAALIIGMITRVILFFDSRLIDEKYEHVISAVVEASFKVLDAN
jgi:AcrR family transcriptional regulator